MQHSYLQWVLFCFDGVSSLSLTSQPIFQTADFEFDTFSWDTATLLVHLNCCPCSLIVSMSTFSFSLLAKQTESRVTCKLYCFLLFLLLFLFYSRTHTLTHMQADTPTHIYTQRKQFSFLRTRNYFWSLAGTAGVCEDV